MRMRVLLGLGAVVAGLVLAHHGHREGVLLVPLAGFGLAALRRRSSGTGAELDLDAGDGDGCAADGGCGGDGCGGCSD